MLRIDFKNGEFVKIVKSRGGGYYLMGSVIRGIERAGDREELGEMVKILAGENGGVRSKRDIIDRRKLVESTDRIKVGDRGYDYTEKSNVVTGVAFDVLNVSDKALRLLVGNSRIGGGVKYFVEALKRSDDELADKLVGEIKGSLDDYGEYLVGHREISNKINVSGNYFDYYDGPDDDLRFRIYEVGGKRYFSMWEGRVEYYIKHRLEVERILAIVGLVKEEVIFEVINLGKYKRYDESDTYIFLSYDELFNRQDFEAEKVKSEVENRLEQVDGKIVELERDFHAKKASLALSERNRYLLDLKNLRSEKVALQAAIKVGEVDLQRVVIQVFDKLEVGDESIPADILYGELEKKLRGYGTSAAQILRRIRDMGVNPKDLMRSYK
jgi:hypothetical protein